MQPLILKIFHHGNLLKSRPFVDDQVSIGSGEGLNLQLEGLSPWHVLIEKKQDTYFVFDLGSEEGTYLDGDKIQGEMQLVSGSVLSMGPYTIECFIGQQQMTKKKSSSKPKISDEKKFVPDLENEDKMDSVLLSKISKESIRDLTGDYNGDKKSRKSRKPNKKGYWNTFAPPSKIKNLDQYLDPSIGNLIEVVVAWKERVLSTHHFYKNQRIHIGSSKDCEIPFPNMLGKEKYKLLTILGAARVHLNAGIRGFLIQGKDKSTRTVTEIRHQKDTHIKPYEMVRLDFGNAISVYVRIVNKPSKAPFAGLLNFNFSETVSFFLAILLTSLLIFYASIYGPAFLLKNEKLLEKDIRIAKVNFQRAPKAPVVDYKLGKQNVKAKPVKEKKKLIKKIRIPKKFTVKKKTKKKKKKKTAKKFINNLKKIGKKLPGKASSQTRSKRRKIPKKPSVGSVRPGGSLKTGKRGSTAKTVAPDPSKVGLLGVFGGGGKMNKLDKGASGQGGLVGLAEESTGYAGTKDAYSGKGVGTRTKAVGSGGQGSSLVGISNIKTKGRGDSAVGTGTGSLGNRGRMNIEFDEDDMDIEGEIDRAGILRVLNQNKVKFNNCYQYSLQQQSSIQGSLKMQWEILPNGNVKSAQPLSDKVGSKVLSNCIARTLKQLNFPAPPSGQIPRVAFRFVFSI